MKCFNRYAVLLVVFLFAVSANGAPMAYSVNSDSDDASAEDNLYLIDMVAGNDVRRGELFTGIETRRDTEGLAFAPDGTLWGIDDRSLTLFPINTSNGAINFNDEISISSLPNTGSNDFGMTFGCDNTLYITSVVTQTLYHLDAEGNSNIIGSLGALGVNISAIAAIGNPTRLYGLGNGQFANGDADSPNLYSIDTDTGMATLIGALGGAIGDYNQAGLAFESNGDLWAITDRRIVDGSIADLASQILKIDIDSGTASMVNTTNEVGFESLAIAPPTACSFEDVIAENHTNTIPTLGLEGRLLAILVLFLTGFGILRKRSF